METGVIKDIKDRGFGFITPDAGGPDLFFHFKDLDKGTDESHLMKGARVGFGLRQGDRGPVACEVRILSAEPEPAVQRITVDEAFRGFDQALLARHGVAGADLRPLQGPVVVIGMSTYTPPKTLAEMQAEVVAYNHAMGWRENDVTFGEAWALLHTEIAEASDAWRRWGLADATAVLTYTDQATGQYALAKPEGVGSEFADIFIRLLDDCDLYVVDLQAELDGQNGRFGLSDSFLENMNALHTLVARAFTAWDAQEPFAGYFGQILMFLRQLCEHYGIDLDAEYRRKMAYNKTRPYRHGGKRL